MMCPRNHWRSLLIGTVLCLHLLEPSVVAEEQVHVINARDVKIVSLKGEVKIMRNGAPEWDKASEGQKLYPGDQLKVGKEGVAYLIDGTLTIITLGSESWIVRKEGSRFQLLRGLLHFFHRDKPGQLGIET